MIKKSDFVLNRPTVSIIVVTMNTPSITENCLRSVLKHSTVPYELIVVNNSRARAIGDSLKKFSGIQVIQNPRNVGYTKAVNQGALRSRGEFLCFLNSDTWVPPRWLERLLDAARLPRAGAVSPLNDRGRSRFAWPSRERAAIEASALLTDEAFQKWYAGRTKDSQWLCGFCLMIPRTVMTRMGLFDERFFFGWEDIDYSLQLRLKGYRLIKTEFLFVHHRRGASSTARRHRELVNQSKKIFLSKWSSFFKTTLRSDLAVFAAVNRETAKLQKQKSRLKKPASQKTSRWMRTGYAIRSKKRKKIEALVRWSDLEMFAPDSRSKKNWDLLSGAALHARCAAPFFENGLAARVRPKATHVAVTVMMAAHNAERWITEAIESVLTQTFTNFELILIDDCSTDRTAQIARRYQWHPRFRFFQNERQLGIAPTRNRILRLARGRYIAVCDADDMMRPTLLGRFADFLDTHPSIGWVYADRLEINAEGHFVGVCPALTMDGIIEYKKNVMHHAGALIRRKLMLKVGGYDQTLLSTEDYDLAFKVARHTQLAALSGETHYLYRWHPDNTSSRHPWAQSETDRLVRRARSTIKQDR